MNQSPVQLNREVERALMLERLVLQPVRHVGHGALDHEGGCFVHLSIQFGLGVDGHKRIGNEPSHTHPTRKKHREQQKKQKYGAVS